MSLEEELKLLDKCKEGISYAAVGKLFRVTENRVYYNMKINKKCKSLGFSVPPLDKQVLQIRDSALSKI